MTTAIVIRSPAATPDWLRAAPTGSMRFRIRYRPATDLETAKASWRAIC